MDKDFLRVGLRDFTVRLKRVFGTRKIIIMSGDRVGQYNLCFKKQLLILILIVGVSSGISFFLGSYLSVRTALEDKKKEFFSISLENNKLEKQFSLLKKDIQRLNIEDTKLDDYSKFILDQYKGKEIKSADLNKHDEYNNYVGRIFERVSYLEENLQNLVNETRKRDEILRMLSVQTENKIEEFDRIIRKTGVKTKYYKRKNPLEIYEEKYKNEKEDNFWKSNFISRSDKNNDIGKNNDSQGGPYEPLDISILSKEHKLLVDNVDDMMKMYDILIALPVDKPYYSNYRVSSRYGRRKDPFTGRWAMHRGIDFVAPEGLDNILSTNNGIVTYSGRKGAYGNLVEIDHGYGISTRYGHLDEIYVTTGQVVKKGQIIATQGNTGRSTGEHLHYEVRFGNRSINPIRFFRLKKYVLNQTQQRQE